MKKLLLIIDMQEGFRYVESEAILPNILELTESFSGAVVFSKFVNNKGSLFEQQLNWIKFQEEKDTKLFSELQAPNNIEFEHGGYTVLNNNLIKLVEDHGIVEVFLCGIYTDVCIIKTAMDLFDKNIEAFVIEDACGSLDGKSLHDSAILSLRHIIGKKHVLSTNQIKNI